MEHTKIVKNHQQFEIYGILLFQYNFSTLKGLQNSVTRCLNFPAMCSQWMGPLHMQVQVYHPDVIKTVLTKTCM